MKHLTAITILICLFISVEAQDIKNNPGSNHANRFEQLGTMLPTPNEFRTASGAPGPKYWQQRCDYDITAVLDEPNHRLNGKETITYFNNLMVYKVNLFTLNLDPSIFLVKCIV